MNTKQFALEQAVKLISTMSIENKTKAVFDFADEIIKYLGVENKPMEESLNACPVCGDRMRYTSINNRQCPKCGHTSANI